MVEPSSLLVGTKSLAMGYLIVFLGAGIGGAARHGVNQLTARLFGPDFPWGTLTVNVVGCFLMAIIAEAFALRMQLPQDARLFLTTRILGGFTTFSAFSLDIVTLYERGALAAAALYLIASIVGSLIAFFVGLWLI